VSDDAVQQRISLLTDYLAIAARLEEFFNLIRTADTFEDLIQQVAASFAISEPNAQMLVDLPIRHWGPEGIRRRTAELDRLRP
jgi:DNA gyrase/topoisomerase IV subunit A